MHNNSITQSNCKHNIHDIVNIISYNFLSLSWCVTCTMYEDGHSTLILRYRTMQSLDTVAPLRNAVWYPPPHTWCHSQMWGLQINQYTVPPQVMCKGWYYNNIIIIATIYIATHNQSYQTDVHILQLRSNHRAVVNMCALKPHEINTGWADSV